MATSFCNQILNLDYKNQKSINLLINGYFRQFCFFEYYIKMDNFIGIISKYLNEKCLKFIKENKKKIEIFANGCGRKIYSNSTENGKNTIT